MLKPSTVSQCDIDQNGLISLNELKQFLEVMRKRNKISQTKLERLYNKADKNNDNMIDREEFQEMIKDPLFHRYLKGYLYHKHLLQQRY